MKSINQLKVFTFILVYANYIQKLFENWLNIILNLLFVCFFNAAHVYMETVYTRDWQIFFIKGQIVNILAFVVYMITFVFTELCQCSIKVDLDNT